MLDDEDHPGELSKFLKDEQMIKQLRKNDIFNLFPVQQASFFIIARGYDLTARDRTGSGKTLAYSLPSLERLRKNNQLVGNKPKILIMVPTR